jgi:hypothetical protein
MPKKNYHLNSDKTETLIIEWKGFYKNLKVQINENDIFYFENKKALKAGGKYKIDKNRELTIQLTKEKLTGIETLQILINNEPIKGSPTDPFEILKGVLTLLFILSGLNLIFGLIAELFSIELLLHMGLGIGNVVVGLIYGLLGYMVKVKYSLTALILSILLLASDLIFCLIYMNSSVFATSMIKFFFIYMLSRGIGAIKKIKKQDLKDLQRI